MNFLLDSDICSKLLRGEPRAWQKFMQHGGQIGTSTVVVAELCVAANRLGPASAFTIGLEWLLKTVAVLDFDLTCARRFGEIRSALLSRGRPAPISDTMIAATALVHDLILVTHNVVDFEHVPDLQLIDWLAD